jgi:hypothetical protein
LKERRSTTTAPTIHFIGNSDDIRAAVELVRNWGYNVSQQLALNAVSIVLPLRTIIITEASFAATVDARYPEHGAIISLCTRTGSEALPKGVQELMTPVRPAKLRALIGQLQKTFSKSIP